MKKFECALLVALLSVGAGCHDSGGTGNPDLGVDAGGVGGGGSEDMAAPDLATAKLGCGGILQCLGSCMSQACAQGCYGKASASGGMKFQAMIQCLYMVCSETDDAGASSCMGAQDQSMGCQQCLIGELNAPTQCQPQVTACESDQ